MRTITRRMISIPLISDAIDTPYETLDALKAMFDFSSEISALPILQNDGSHQYFTLRKVCGPYEITDKDHVVYGTDFCGSPRMFNRPELVGRIAVDEYAQVSPEGSEAVILKDEYLGFEGDLLILLSAWHEERPNNQRCLIMGSRACREQLKVWGIDDPKLDVIL